MSSSMLHVMPHRQRKCERELQRLRQSRRQMEPMKHRLETMVAGEEVPRSQTILEKDSEIETDLVVATEEMLPPLMISLDS